MNGNNNTNKEEWWQQIKNDDSMMPIKKDDGNKYSWAKIWNFGKRGKIKKSYLGVFTNIHDLYLRWTLIFQWLLIEFLHKILKKIILKTAFYKSSNCVKFQDILWNRFSFDFLVFSGIFFPFSQSIFMWNAN